MFSSWLARHSWRENQEPFLLAEQKLSKPILADTMEKIFQQKPILKLIIFHKYGTQAKRLLLGKTHIIFTFSILKVMVSILRPMHSMTK